MIRGGFLAPSIREDLIALVRDGKAETRLTRRANALLLLDDGMSCEAIAKVLYLDDDTIRYWYKLYGEKGLSWLADFGYKGRACELTAAQQEARPAGCWAPKDAKVAIEQTSGRQRLNIHGAIDLETGATRMIEATTIDALSTIALLMAIMLMYPTKRLIHVFLDNARYHHAVIVQAWLARPGCRIKLHYIPSYCPHLDPIERLWGLMHRHVTHNRSHATYNDFCRSVLHFLRREVPKNWAVFCDSVTDNFRVINPAGVQFVT